MDLEDINRNSSLQGNERITRFPAKVSLFIG